MQGLEQLITRVKQQLCMNRASEDVYTDLIAQGVHTDLAHWAVRAAQFEIDEEKKADNDRIN